MFCKHTTRTVLLKSECLRFKRGELNSWAVDAAGLAIEPYKTISIRYLTSQSNQIRGPTHIGNTDASLYKTFVGFLANVIQYLTLTSIFNQTFIAIG